MTADELVPIYGFVRGDTLGVLVLMRSTDTVAQLAAALKEAAVRAGDALSTRVACIVAAPRALAPEQTLSAAGLTPLVRVDLVPEAD